MSVCSSNLPPRRKVDFVGKCNTTPRCMPVLDRSLMSSLSRQVMVTTRSKSGWDRSLVMPCLVKMMTRSRACFFDTRSKLDDATAAFVRFPFIRLFLYTQLFVV